MSDDNDTPVHCDSSILHAPGECEYCDKYGAKWQRYRELARINFTGHEDDDKAPCPSTYFRPTSVVHRWPGNQPQEIVEVTFMPSIEDLQKFGPDHARMMEAVAENDDDPARDGECHLAPMGWWCSRGEDHKGPCAAWARWWNLRAPRELRKRKASL